jgi:alpha/beta superfamily hydrolase
MSKPPKTELLNISGPAGLLEAIVETPSDSNPAAIVVLCHPHPLFDGTMRNKVVHTLARAFVAQGFAAVRFNFRGAGKSGGIHDDGRGEVDDALAVLDWSRNRWPDLPWWLGGFSFGAMVAINCAIRKTSAGLVTIAPPVQKFAGELADQPRCPWLIIQGDKDDLVNVDEVLDWVNSLEPGPELQIKEDTDHFFHGKLVDLRESVSAFVAKHFM